MKNFFGEKRKTLTERITKKHQKAINELENMEITIPDDTTDKSAIKKDVLKRAIAATLAAGTMLTITGCSSRNPEDPEVDSSSSYTDVIDRPSVDITSFNIERETAFTIEKPDEDELYGYYQIVNDSIFKHYEGELSNAADQQGNKYESMDEPLYLSREDLIVCSPYRVVAKNVNYPYIKFRYGPGTIFTVIGHLYDGSLIYLGRPVYTEDDPYNWQNTAVKDVDRIKTGYAAIGPSTAGAEDGGKVEKCTDVNDLVGIVDKDTKLLTRDQVIERVKNQYKDYKIIAPSGRIIRTSPGISEYNTEFRIYDDSGDVTHANIEIPYGGIIKIDEESESVEKNGFIWRECLVKYNDKIVEGYLATGKEDGSTYVELVPEVQEQSRGNNEERE